jgi:hypothetical protein
MLDKLTLDPERPGYFEGYGETHNWTHKCELWELSYMPTLILMHNIDVMHQERSVGESEKTQNTTNVILSGIRNLK